MDRSSPPRAAPDAATAAVLPFGRHPASGSPARLAARPATRTASRSGPQRLRAPWVSGIAPPRRSLAPPSRSGTPARRPAPCASRARPRRDHGFRQDIRRLGQSTRGLPGTAAIRRQIPGENPARRRSCAARVRPAATCCDGGHNRRRHTARRYSIRRCRRTTAE